MYEVCGNHVHRLMCHCDKCKKHLAEWNRLEEERRRLAPFRKQYRELKLENAKLHLQKLFEGFTMEDVFDFCVSDSFTDVEDTEDVLDAVMTWLGYNDG